MKRAAIGFYFLLCAAAIPAQSDPNARPPAIGRCEAAELRMRERPSKDAGQVGSLFQGEEAVILCRTPVKEKIDGREGSWFQVCGMKGVLGWVFGGYFKADEAGVAEKAFEDYDPPTAEVKDIGAGFPGGSLAIVRVVWTELHPSRFDALFMKAAGSAPRVLLAEHAGETENGWLEWGNVEFLDLVGDAKKEICLTATAGGGDTSGESMRVIGDLGKGYAYLGDIDLGESDGGGGGIGGFYEAQGGPRVVAEKGVKLVKVVMKSVYVEPKAGERGLFRTEKVYEQSYMIVGSKLVKTGTKEISRIEEAVDS